MNTKLTLSIDEAIIAGAKKKVQTKGTSLSGLIEEYLGLLIGSKTYQQSESPIVDELTGIVKSHVAKSKRGNTDDLVADYLLEKYT